LARSNIKEALTFGSKKLTIVVKHCGDLVIPDCRERGKSGIHNHRPSRTRTAGVMDSGLAANQVGCCRLGLLKVSISGTPEIDGAPE
jgi:hypothetical protein